jgi:SulP family sulfate permease
MRLRAAKKQVVLAGPLPEPRAVFDRANLPKHHEHVHFAATLDAGLELAAELARAEPPSVAKSTVEA